MTSQQAKTIRNINAAHEAERFTASQAGREQSRATLRARALEYAGELALLGRFRESRRVLELNFFVAEEE